MTLEILIDYHANFIMVEEDGTNEGGDTAGGQTEVGVDDSALLKFFRGHGAVEGRPEHPQEDGTNHGEEVSCLRVELERVEVAHAVLPSVQHSRHGQAEVSAKDVDKDGATDVQGLQVVNTYPFIHAENGHFDECHD